MVLHRIEHFSASISTQGMDRHIHIPRRFHKRLVDDGLMNKTFKVTILLEEIVQIPASV